MPNIKTEIDSRSGFCFGVVNAIKKAEEELGKGETLYCLGDIVHNSQEVARLEKLGLRTINHEELAQLKNAKVLLRAHGEPPSTYETAQKNNITIIDASCPVVLHLQNKIKRAYQENPDEQIVIYGKNGHAEVNGLVGQTLGTAIVVENAQDLDKIDFNRGICLFSQTTKSVDGFNEVVEIIKQRIAPGVKFNYNDTICRQVANRIPDIRQFARQHDIVLFVSGKKSSNGKALFEECRKVNPRTYFISEPNEINPEWLKGIRSIGICGATSAPKWLMEDIERKIII
jgi:4-hydroxy-3-methylbut-2-enyl diphosphate reductase